MSRSSGKKPKTGFAVWFVLIGFPVFGLVLLWELDLFGKAEGAFQRWFGLSKTTILSPDVQAGALSALSGSVVRQPDVRILARPPEGGMEVSKPDCDWLSGRVSFRVAPTGLHRDRTFATFDIASAVEKGTSPARSSGIVLYGDVSVRTNAEDGCWIVDYSGVRPGGTLSLEVGGSKASVSTRSPDLGRLSALWRRDRLSFSGNEVRINGRSFRRGDFLPPDPTTETPGFRVLGVTSGCVWLEIIYSARSETVLDDRERWPRIEIGRMVRGDRVGNRVVRFEGGYELSEGKDAVFPEKDRLSLHAGGILAPNAVRFEYFGPGGHLPVDLLVLCVH